MERKEYNGWTNYETWLANVWFSNDGTQELFEESAAEITRRLCDQDEDGDDLPLTDEQKDEATAELAEQIQQYTSDAAPVGLVGLYLDLITTALSEINYSELAQHYIDDANTEA